MNKRVIIYTIIACICSFLLIYSEKIQQNQEPTEVYRVYLKGKSLGLIKSKTALEDYIDKKQESIKKKYGVNKVYVPDELDITKEVTFNEKTTSINKIYEKIKNISPFTIDGYAAKIKGLTSKNAEGKKVRAEDKIIYILNQKNFKKAVNNTVKSFVTQEKYNNYANNSQSEIKETGSIIENLYIKNKIGIRFQKIPVDKDIYITEEDITKILLFGTTDEQQKYTVKAGDTIEDVSFNNKISTDEFLIANTSFKDKNALLFEGQEVNIGIIQPQFSVVEEDHTISDQDVNYETEVKYDSSKSKSYSVVEQAGVQGKNRVTQKIQKINGETTNVVTTNTEELSAPVKEIVVKGGKESNNNNYYGSGYGSVVATRGQWGWPASCGSPATISSPFGYRWGTLHDGTDIAGCGRGSNIFAAQDGVVVKVSSKYDNGRYVIINHNNGYYSLYAHLNSQNVSEGQTVGKGQIIGTMGNTGAATGVHLHFAMWTGYPYYGGRALNAMSFY